MHTDDPECVRSKVWNKDLDIIHKNTTTILLTLCRLLDKVMIL